jgi:hypothetical protein
VEVQKAEPAPLVTADPGDPAWKDVEGFPLKKALNSDPLDHQTTVKVLWSEDDLYVRFLSEETEIVVPETGARDLKLFRGDVVEVFLDVVGDSRQWVEFQFSPYGDVSDLNIVMTAEPLSDEQGLLTSEVYPSEYWKNWSYDMTALRSSSNVQTLENGNKTWIVDCAIPAKDALRRRKLKEWGSGLEVRAHFVRYDRSAPDSPLQHHTWNPRMLRGNPHRTPLLMGKLILK